MTAIIAYHSVYGSTRQYAEELARVLDTAVVTLEQADTALEGDPGAPLIVLSPIHGPSHAGASFIVKRNLGERPVALCTVGMTLDQVAVEKDSSAQLLGSKADAVTRFYLPGRLNYSELSSAHRSTMWAVVNLLRMKRRKSDNDKMMIETKDTDVDRVDLTRLDQVVDWARSNGA